MSDKTLYERIIEAEAQISYLRTREVEQALRIEALQRQLRVTLTLMEQMQEQITELQKNKQDKIIGYQGDPFTPNPYR